MHRSLRSLLALCVLGLTTAGCANRSHDASDTSAPGPQAEDAPQASDGGESADASGRAAVALDLRAHDTMLTEVVPDPDGVAALTLDADGGVRLWPDLHADAVAAPIQMPAHEPVWMSLARDKGGFVVAFIDTAGAARVAHVEPDGKGAHLQPLFDTSPTDPLLEVHVLRGGTQILALGVDHRVRLYDRHGAVTAELDRPGFVPWQLRVAQPEGGDPVVLAVLSGPVRVQAIAVAKNDLALQGEARSIALDRGPNRNDLELSPDGTTVLALMRRKTKSTRFELEAIDLASGERRIVAADSDAKIRPRVLALGGSRVLLETGSGNGLHLDVARAGSVWPPLDGTPDRDALPVVTLEPVALPGSSEAARMHATLAGGIRLVPTIEGLVVDPLADGEPARVLGAAPFVPTAAALDARGERVAWATAEKIVIETPSGEVLAHRVPAPSERAELLAFVGSDALAVMDAKGRVRLHRIDDGAEIASTQVPVSWGIAASGFRPAKDAPGGEIVLSSLDPGQPVRVLPVTASGLGELRAIPKAERTAWPEAGRPSGSSSADFLAAHGLSLPSLRLRPAKVLLADPDPSGARMALAQKIAEDEGTFDIVEDRWIDGDKTFIVTVVDRERDARAWSVPARNLADIAWSADGTRVAIADVTGGLVLDATTGETVHERRDLGVQAKAAIPRIAAAAR